MFKKTRRYFAAVLSNLDTVATTQAIVAGDVRTQTEQIAGLTKAVAALTEKLERVTTAAEFLAKVEASHLSRTGYTIS